MNSKRKFAIDVGWVFIGSIVVLLLHFIKNPIIARYLGPEGLGLFTTIEIIAGFITLLAGFGIDSAVIKYVSEYKENKIKRSGIFSAGFVTMAIFGVVSSIALFLLSDKLSNIFKNPSLSDLLKIYAFIFPFLLMYGIINAFFNGMREMKYYAFFNIIYNFLVFSLIITFLFLGLGIKGAILGNILAVILVIILASIVLKKFVHFAISEYKENTKKLTIFGSQMMLGNAINNITNYQADTLLIAYFLSATDVGYYAVAVSLSRFFWRIPQSIQIVAFASTSEYWAKGDFHSLNKLINKSMKYSAFFLLPAGLGIWFFAKDLITFLYGNEFAYSVLPLQILIIGTVINGIISRPIGGTLAGSGYPSLELIKVIISATSNILLNLFLIPRFGVAGAAMATTISLSLASGLSIFLIVRTLHIKIDFIWFAKAFGTTIISILIFMYLCNNNINIYISGISILLFFSFVFFQFLLIKEDKEMIKSLLYNLILKIKMYIHKS